MGWFGQDYGLIRILLHVYGWYPCIYNLWKLDLKLNARTRKRGNALVKITQMRIERYCYGKLKKKKKRQLTITRFCRPLGNFFVLWKIFRLWCSWKMKHQNEARDPWHHLLNPRNDNKTWTLSVTTKLYWCSLMQLIDFNIYFKKITR